MGDEGRERETRERDGREREREREAVRGLEDRHEPAARKMEVDENYDDEGEEDKRMGGMSKRGGSNGAPTERKSPGGATNGTRHAGNGIINGGAMKVDL